MAPLTPSRSPNCRPRSAQARSAHVAMSCSCFFFSVGLLLCGGPLVPGVCPFTDFTAALCPAYPRRRLQPRARFRCRLPWGVSTIFAMSGSRGVSVLLNREAGNFNVCAAWLLLMRPCVTPIPAGGLWGCPLIDLRFLRGLQSSQDSLTVDAARLIP